MNTALQPGRRKIGTHCNQAAVKLEPLWNQAGAEPGQTVSVTVLSLALSPLLGLHSLQESKDSYSPLTPNPHFPISFLFPWDYCDLFRLGNRGVVFSVEEINGTFLN